MSVILDEFSALIHGRKHTKSREWTNINCPACGDTRWPGRGGFYTTETGGFRYSCFNGGCPYNTKPTGWEPGNGLVGRVKELFELLGGDIKRIPSSERLPKNSKNKKRTKNDSVVTTFPDASLPPNTMMLEDVYQVDDRAERVMAYLFDRSPVFIDIDFPFMWSSKYPNYLIVPYIHYDDQIVGYMGRNIDKEDGGGRFIQRAPRDYMFNQYQLTKGTGKYVYVMESPLDAVLFDGLGTRDNRLSQRQINLLNKTSRQPVLIPDLKDGEWGPYLKAAKENNWLVSVPEWKYKDPGEAVHDLGLLNTIDMVTSSMTKNYTKLEFMIRKMVHNNA